MNIGDILTCMNVEPLNGNSVAPPLQFGRKDYPLKNIILDGAGNEHFDVGLISEYNYVCSIETGEELKDGDKIHWCHPSRFKLTEK